VTGPERKEAERYKFEKGKYKFNLTKGVIQFGKVGR